MSKVVEICPDPAALTVAAANRLVNAINSAIRDRGQASIVLTGGGVGIALLEHIGDNHQGIDWAKVHFFWGDDRYVPRDNDERNEKQAREALIDRVDIPPTNVHPMPARDGEFGNDLDAAAAAYQRELVASALSDGACFDVHLLGMGAEGHINSLFPDTAAVREGERLVVAVAESPKPPPQRISLTLPAIRRSRQVWLMVAGDAKALAVAAAIDGADPVSVPAAGAVGTEATVWLLDHAASERVQGRQAEISNEVGAVAFRSAMT